MHIISTDSQIIIIVHQNRRGETWYITSTNWIIVRIKDNITHKRIAYDVRWNNNIEWLRHTKLIRNYVKLNHILMQIIVSIQYQQQYN